jgi:hypothetical protein
MRRRNLPQLVDIRLRSVEIIALERRFGFRNQIRDFLRILRSLNDSGGCRMWRLAPGSKQLESKHHHDQHGSGTAADHHSQPPGIEFLRGRFEVGARSPRHCRRLGE